MLFDKKKFLIVIVPILSVLSLTVEGAPKRPKPKVCKQMRTELGDDCDSIAERCGISTRKLKKYNPESHVCDMDLVPSGIPLCCSRGNLPFPLPLNDDDGTCATYILQENETCVDIATRLDLPMSFIEKINKQADWGWMGCDKLVPNQPMCLSNGTAPDDSAEPDDETLLPSDCAASPYNTLEDIDAALNSGTYDEECLNQYTLEVLQKNLQTSLDRYNAIMADHYDNKFNTFADAVVNSAPKQVHDFMLQHGNEYFTCVVTELQFCCSDSCQSVGNDPNGPCRYCYQGKCDMVDFMGRPIRRDSGGVGVILGGGDHPGDGSHSVSRVTNVSEPCPPDYSLRGLSQKQQPQERRDTVYWTLRPDRADQFYADIYATTALTKERIAMQDVYHMGDCPPTGNCHDNGWDFGIPVANGYSKADVANPKDVVVAALANLTSLHVQISGVIDEMRNGTFLGSGADVVDAISVPVLMIESAVDSMETVVDTAEEIDEERTKGIILTFLGALLFFIPVVGEVLGSIAGLASLARIIAVLATVGDAAMDIYSIVDDPKNAPLAIFGLVLGPLGLADIATVARAANLKRAMKGEDILKLGKNLGPSMNIVNKVTGVCRKS